MSGTPKTDDEVAAKLEALIDSLEEEPPTKEEAEEIVKALGVDTHALAAKIRAQVAAVRAKEPTKHDSLREDYERSRGRSKTREREPIRPRAEQLARIRVLLERSKDRPVAAHFRKLEEVNEEESAELLTTLRDLVEGGDDDE